MTYRIAKKLLTKKVNKEVSIITILLNNAGIGIIEKFLDFNKCI